jgi:drug/metabolite transporter (DMT)-like permease
MQSNASRPRPPSCSRSPRCCGPETRWSAGSRRRWCRRITLNFLRWALAFVLLLPFAWRLLRAGSPLWPRMGRFAVLGLLGVGCYNALQYLAVKTSTPINVTLVASSLPAFMLGLGALFFGQRITRRQVAGALLSIAGVLVVLSQGELAHLAQVRFVVGDVYMLLATAAWARL